MHLQKTYISFWTEKTVTSWVVTFLQEWLPQELFREIFPLDSPKSDPGSSALTLKCPFGKIGRTLSSQQNPKNFSLNATSSASSKKSPAASSRSLATAHPEQPTGQVTASGDT